jgi:hypothetical protein
MRQDFAALGGLIMQKVLIAVEEPDTATESTPSPTTLRSGSRRAPSTDPGRDPATREIALIPPSGIGIQYCTSRHVGDPRTATP